MIWVIDKIKTRLVLDEAGRLLDIPIQVEVEYGLDGTRVQTSSASKKIYFNRPALLKECPGRTAAELDRLVDEAVRRAIESHFSTRGYLFEEV
ncbi:MAG: hypothetical protein NTV99_05315 [Deltaproteobacteria bacterium]|nr:hypothetical protein [Deltaproteobacteria bacterium]